MMIALEIISILFVEIVLILLLFQAMFMGSAISKIPVMLLLILTGITKEALFFPTK